MATRDLVAKYGQTGGSRGAINRAVRLELVGGDDCLDGLDRISELIRKRSDRGWEDWLDDAKRAHRHLSRVAAGMRAEIRTRYGMPPEAREEE